MPILNNLIAWIIFELKTLYEGSNKQVIFKNKRKTNASCCLSLKTLNIYIKYQQYSRRACPYHIVSGNEKATVKKAIKREQKRKRNKSKK